MRVFNIPDLDNIEIHNQNIDFHDLTRVIYFVTPW